jgi:hypothetical protein
MEPKDPASFGLITYLWVIGLSLGGGLVSYMHKLQLGVRRPFSIIEFIGELVTSGFTGVITYFLCQSSGISPLLTAVFVGISGHMGSRALFLIERMIENKLKKFVQ